MQLSKPPKPKATRKRLKKEILSDDFKKRKIFWKKYCGKFSMKNFPPHITRGDSSESGECRVDSVWQFHTSGECTDQLNNYQLLNTDFTPRS
jgi:hypothetical protein